MPITAEALNQVFNPKDRPSYRNVPIVNLENAVDLNNFYAVIDRDLPASERGTLLVIKNQLRASLKKEELAAFTKLTPDQFNKFHKTASILLKENDRSFSWYGHTERNLTNLKVQMTLETASMSVNEASIEYSSASAINLVNQSDRYLQINKGSDDWMASQVKNIIKATNQLEARSKALKRQIQEASYSARPKEAFEASLEEINQSLEKSKQLIARIENPVIGQSPVAVSAPVSEPVALYYPVTVARRAPIVPVTAVIPTAVAEPIVRPSATPPSSPSVPDTAATSTRAADIADETSAPVQRLANGRTVVDTSWEHTPTNRIPVQRQRREFKLPSLNVEPLLAPIRDLNDYLENMRGSFRLRLPSKKGMLLRGGALGLALGIAYGGMQEIQSQSVSKYVSREAQYINQYGNLVFGKINRVERPLRPNIASSRVQVLEQVDGKVTRFILTNNARQSIELTTDKPLADRMRFNYQTGFYIIENELGQSMELGDIEIKDLSPTLDEVVKDIAPNYEGSVASWFMDKASYENNIRELVIQQSDTPVDFDDLRKDGILVPTVKSRDLVVSPKVPADSQLILAPYVWGY